MHIYTIAFDLTPELPLLHLHSRDNTVVSRRELDTARLSCPVTVCQGDGLLFTGALKAFGLLPNLDSHRYTLRSSPIPLTCISHYLPAKLHNLLLTQEHHGHPLYDGNSSNLVDS